MAKNVRVNIKGLGRSFGFSIAADVLAPVDFMWTFLKDVMSLWTYQYCLALILAISGLSCGRDAKPRRAAARWRLYASGVRGHGGAEAEADQDNKLMFSDSSLF